MQWQILWIWMSMLVCLWANVICSCLKTNRPKAVYKIVIDCYLLTHIMNLYIATKRYEKHLLLDLYISLITSHALIWTDMKNLLLAYVYIVHYYSHVFVHAPAYTYLIPVIWNIRHSWHKFSSMRQFDSPSCNKKYYLSLCFTFTFWANMC